MEVLLNDVCDIQYGFAFDSKQFSESEGVPVIRIRDLLRGYSETYTTEEFNKEYLVSNGDLLIGMDGEFNIVRWGGAESALNQRVCKLIPNVLIDKDYLYYRMPSVLKAIEAKTPFVTVKHLSAKELNRVSFKLPSLENQKKIASILNKVDYLIEIRKSQLNQMDELVKSRFVEMFGDESNPYNFPIVNIEDVASVQVGVVIKPAQYYTDAGNGIKTFRSLNIGPMHIKDTDWVYFSEEGNRKNQKSVLNENDLVIVRSGAPGTACVITKEYAGCNAVDIIIARPDLDKVNPYYLCQYTNLPHGKKQIEEGTGGAAQQHFNVGKYNKIRLTLPPLDQQLKFEKFVEQNDKSKLAVQKSLEQLEILKKSLMQAYFG